MFIYNGCIQILPNSGTNTSCFCLNLWQLLSGYSHLGLPMTLHLCLVYCQGNMIAYSLEKNEATSILGLQVVMKP